MTALERRLAAAERRRTQLLNSGLLNNCQAVLVLDVEIASLRRRLAVAR